MTSDKDEMMLGEFLAAATEEWRKGLAEASEQVETVATYARLLEIAPVYGQQESGTGDAGKSQIEEALGNSFEGLANSPVYRAVRGESGGGGAMPVLRNGLGAIPRLLISLFGGGSEEREPAPLVKYAMPAGMRFEAADGRGGSLSSVDYGQDGLPRAYATERARGAGQQVTIQVQAMDSRSFLDHKEEIARAVREAMLNTHSLNDVVSEL